MTIRLCKKFKGLDVQEEKELKAKLRDGQGAIDIIVQYLEKQVVSIDNQLANPGELYKVANSDRYVSFKLAERASLMTLRKLLTEEIK